jgi:hypothetical protein
VTGCTATFESNIDLDTHIAANQHDILNEIPRTANDIARVHLTDILRTTTTQSRVEASTILQHQHAGDLSLSAHYESFSSPGWALRTRKLGNPMGEEVKNFVEQMWHESIKTKSRITPEHILEQIRSKRDNNGAKFFQTHQYPTKNQIKYRFRKLNNQYGVTVKDQLITEIIDDNIE